MFKPLFAITILGLNGRIPLNTAGNIQGRFPYDLVNPTAGTVVHGVGEPAFELVWP